MGSLHNRLLLVVFTTLLQFPPYANSQKCVFEPPLPEGISNTEVTPESKEAFLAYLQCKVKECEDLDPEIIKSLGKGIPGHAVDCPDIKEKFTCEVDGVAFWEVIADSPGPVLAKDGCPETCEMCGGGAAGKKCVFEPPLPEGISNTEVTPESKEAFLAYLQCKVKECEDLDPEIIKSLGKGIPGHAVDCPDIKEKFTCEVDGVAFWEVIADSPGPVLAKDGCPETCEMCEGTASAAPAPTPAPKPSPKPAPKPAPTPAPKEDSTADMASDSKVFFLAPWAWPVFVICSTIFR